MDDINYDVEVHPSIGHAYEAGFRHGMMNMGNISINWYTNRGLAVHYQNGYNQGLSEREKAPETLSEYSRIVRSLKRCPHSSSCSS